MKIFIDTEFIEDGRTIELLSIGMVREDGASLYREVMGVDVSRANDWVRKHVLLGLCGPSQFRDQIAREVVDFAGPSPVFWGHLAGYDWVALCQLYGDMAVLPDGWPMYCNDLQQLADLIGADLRPLEESRTHNALEDARWVAAEYERLRRRSIANLLGHKLRRTHP